jgi:hypothetical protein
MIRILLVITALFTLSSCGSYRNKILRKYCTADTITTIKVDTFTSFKRDTFYIPADTVAYTWFLECDSMLKRVKPMSKSFGTGHVRGIIMVDTNGILTAKCMADSLLHIIDSLQTTITIDKQTQISKVREVSDGVSPHWRIVAIIGWVILIFQFAFDRIMQKLSK